MISKDQQISGMPAVALRALFRRVDDHSATPVRMAEILADEGVHVDPLELRGTLHDRGFITLSSNAESDEGSAAALMDSSPAAASTQHWYLTVAGRALAKARIGKPMPRSKAQQLLNGLLDRVNTANADPEELWTVLAVGVYGSFTDPDRDHVGDVDVVLLYVPRDPGTYAERCREVTAAAMANGKRFSSFLDEMYYPDGQFRMKLRARKSALDIIYEPSIPTGAAIDWVYAHPSIDRARLPVPL